MFHNQVSVWGYHSTSSSLRTCHSLDTLLSRKSGFAACRSAVEHANLTLGLSHVILYLDGKESSVFTLPRNASAFLQSLAVYGTTEQPTLLIPNSLSLARQELNLTDVTVKGNINVMCPTGNDNMINHD